MNDTRVVVCPHCHTANRVPSTRLGDSPNCGKCKQHLFPGHPIELAAVYFDQHIERSDIPIVVDFWAPWCAPCRSMAPAFAEAARSLEPQFRLVKINTDDQPHLAHRFGIRSIPTLAILRCGREIARRSGALDTGGLIRWITAHA